MRRLLLALAVVTVAVLLFVGLVYLVSESGTEVVTLRTVDAGGSPVETRVWVVDDDGYAWLRAGLPTVGWLARIEAHPEVEVQRGGRWARFRAVPVHDPAVRDRIHAVIREKYGLPDRFISMIRDGTKSVPIRLEPLAD
jgi:F420H(2)-dependent quinone reductase